MSFYRILSENKIGKLKRYNRATKRAELEFFDSPNKELIICEYTPADVSRLPLSILNLFFIYDPNIDFWDLGTISDLKDNDCKIKLLNGQEIVCNISNVFIRENPEAPIDPAVLLKYGVFTPQFFYDNRTRFINNVIKQKVGCLGLTGLISAAVKIVPHQLEVIGRVLRDPIQRYILADEVGLGKTIEAGAILRQHVIDNPNHNEIIIIAPNHLINQWRNELKNRFFLEHLFDNSIRFIGYDELQNLEYDPKDKVDMLIIDEAHQIYQKTLLVNPNYFNTLINIATSSEKVLLLSGTPALNNETDFLAMLSILDPQNYSMKNLEEFKAKVASRSQIGSLYRQLHHTNPLLNYVLEELIELLKNDEDLLMQLEELQQVLAQNNYNPINLVSEINRIRLYISENYRIHHRLLRNSRTNLNNIINQGRNGLITFLFPDNMDSSFARVDSLIQNLIGIYAGKDVEESKNLIKTLLNKYFQSYSKLLVFLEKRMEMDIDDYESGVIRQLLNITRTVNYNYAEWVISELTNFILQHHRKVLIFAADNDIDLLTELLSNQNMVRFVNLENILSQNFYNAFNNNSVILCKDIHQQGLNLQIGAPVIFHYSIPFSPNSIEQRIGRVDRFGSNKPATSLISYCETESLKKSWIEFLEIQLKIFNRSIANLQYLIEEIMISLTDQLRLYGLSGINNLIQEFGGKDGKIEREFDKLTSFENLYSMDSFIESEKAVQKLQALEADEKELQNSFNSWLKCLNVNISERDHQRTRYIINPQSLINDDTLPDYIRDNQNNIQYTFSRELSQNQNLRLARIGDEFYDFIYEQLQTELRGQIFGTIRVTDQIKDGYYTCFKFNNILQINLKGIEDLPYNKNLIQRECDFFFPPETFSTTIDYNGEIVQNEIISHLINQPYSKEATINYKDYNLNSVRWRRFLELTNYNSQSWGELCEIVSTSNETIATKYFEPLFMQRTTNYDNHLEQFKFVYKDRTEFDELIEIKEYLLKLITCYQFTVSSCGLIVLASRDFGGNFE